MRKVFHLPSPTLFSIRTKKHKRTNSQSREITTRAKSAATITARQQVTPDPDHSSPRNRSKLPSMSIRRKSPRNKKNRLSIYTQEFSSTLSSSSSSEETSDENEKYREFWQNNGIPEDSFVYKRSTRRKKKDQQHKAESEQPRLILPIDSSRHDSVTTIDETSATPETPKTPKPS